MNKTKIDWATMSWNPVTGCLHGCPYCYARITAHRYAGYVQDVENIPCRPQGQVVVLDSPLMQRWKDGKLVKASYPFDFTPTLHRYRLNQPMRTASPQNIFVCSMADLFGEWVPDEWIAEVFDACRKAPQHRYLFLTKNPDRYVALAKSGELPEEENFWYGTTATNPDMKFYYSSSRNTFLSMEPLLEPFGEMNSDTPKPKWIIIGAETGNREGKVIPKRGWVEEIAAPCTKFHIPVFYKDNLRTYFPDLPASAYPWEV